MPSTRLSPISSDRLVRAPKRVRSENTSSADRHGVLRVVRDAVDLRLLPRQRPQGRRALDAADQRLGPLALRDALAPVVRARARAGTSAGPGRRTGADARPARPSRQSRANRPPAVNTTATSELDQQGDDLGQRLGHGPHVVAHAGQQVAGSGLLEPDAVEVQGAVERLLAQVRECRFAGLAPGRSPTGMSRVPPTTLAAAISESSDAGRVDESPAVRHGVDDVAEDPRSDEPGESRRPRMPTAETEQRAAVRAQQRRGEAGRLARERRSGSRCRLIAAPPPGRRPGGPARGACRSR